MEGRVSRFRTYLEPPLLLPMPISMGVFVFETVVLHQVFVILWPRRLVRNRRKTVRSF